MRAWEREIWDAAMSSIALVIFLVACTDLIRRRRIRSCPPAMVPPSSFAVSWLWLLVTRREIVDEGLQRRVQLVGVGQRARGADLIEQLGVRRAKRREQFRLEATDVLDGDRVEPALGARVDHDDLLFDRHRGVKTLLQELGQP